MLHIRNLLSADDAGLEAGIFGNPVIRTPNLDGLGRRSLKFTNAFTSVSSCSPRYKLVVCILLAGVRVHEHGDPQ